MPITTLWLVYHLDKMPPSQTLSPRVPHPLGSLDSLPKWWNGQSVFTGPQTSLSVMPTVSTSFKILCGKGKPLKILYSYTCVSQVQNFWRWGPNVHIEKDEKLKKKKTQAILKMYIKKFENCSGSLAADSLQALCSWPMGQSWEVCTFRHTVHTLPPSCVTESDRHGPCIPGASI